MDAGVRGSSGGRGDIDERERDTVVRTLLLWTYRINMCVWCFVHVCEYMCVFRNVYEQLAKTVAVGGFIYGFLYTTATGRPAIDISAKATHTADNGDAADFQVNGMVRSCVTHIQ